jgi:hypothetical protein
MTKDPAAALRPAPAAVEAAVRQWLRDVVVGLDLCPFASRPLAGGQVRISVSDAASEADLLYELQAEIGLLDATPAAELETTLLVLTGLLADFTDFNAFLDSVDALLEAYAWQGRYQVATFHPDYCFAGCDPQDPQNLTNRSPWPILHILREDSLERALAGYAGAQAIPARNIHRVRTLDDADKRRLFHYLYAGRHA